ncbi:MAG: hypothetical protein ABI321_00605 [Polyangia bacterium]
MRAAFVVLLLASACGPGRYEAFRNQLVDSSCAWARRCGQAGRGERASCGTDGVLAILHDAAADRAAPDALDLPASIDEHRLGYDSVDAQSCLDAVERSPCDPVLAARKRGRICDVVVRPRAQVGALCTSDLECEGGVCVHEPSCKGTCVAYASYGAPCGTSDVEHTCDPTVAWCSGTCQPKRARGKACSDDVACAIGFVCVDGTCADPIILDDGTTCDGSEPCKSGRYCDPAAHVCTKQLQRGVACDTALACQDGLACLGLVGGTTGTCTDWGDVGSSCSSTGVSGCPRSQTCEGGVCTAPSFVPYAAERCVTTPCAAGLGCSLTQVCDWLHPRAGSCSGAAATLCEPGLVCSTYGDDLGVGPGVCTSTDVASCPPVTVDAGL